MDYSEIAAQIARGADTIVELRSASLAILLSALNAINSPFDWHNSGVELTNGEFDIVEGWLDGAALDILTVYECEDAEPMTDKLLVLAYQTALNTNGGSSSVGHNQIPLNTVVIDTDDLLQQLSGGTFKLNVAGFYYVYASIAVFQVGWSVPLLYRHESPYGYVAQGENADYGDNPIMNCVVELAADTFYDLAVYANIANTDDGLGHARNKGNYESFATLTLKLLEYTE